jgi:hypothetical protein
MTRRKFLHRVIFTRALAVRVIEIRCVPLFRRPWGQSSFVTIWAPEHLEFFRDATP